MHIARVRRWMQAAVLAAGLGLSLGMPAAALAAATPTPTATAAPPQAKATAAPTQTPAAPTQPPAAPTQAPAAPTQPAAAPTQVLSAPTQAPAAPAQPPSAPAQAPAATVLPSPQAGLQATPLGAAASPTPAHGQSPAPTPAAPSATSGSAAGTPPAAPAASPSTGPSGSPTATPPPAGTTTPTPSPLALLATSTPLPTGDGVIRGSAFNDTDANGVLGTGEVGLINVQVTLSSTYGLARSTYTADDATFSFDGLAPGTYHIGLSVPGDYVATTDAGQDVEVVDGEDPPQVQFGLISLAAAGLAPDDTAAESDDEQIIALASVSSLPLRFAEGRDLMAQVQRRVLGDGLVWLGVPFRSQIDGGDFQYVNCGPASLTMVLAGFGLEVGPSQVRDYLNNLIDNFNVDQGTSLDMLSKIAKDAGLTPMDLYSEAGGYRNWSTDAVRWHVQQGHPVLTLVKYRNLPGHSKSLSEFDHYIVISGLTPNGFIYNDAAFATTLGYGLEISDVELEYAWDNSSIPHHALALGLDPDAKALTFPEVPRSRRLLADSLPVAARGARRLAESDEAERAPLILTPSLPLAPSPPTAFAGVPGPLLSASDRWQDDPNFQSVDEPGTPMGLNMEQTDQPALEARPGPGAIVPKLFTVLGIGWLVWAVWSFSLRLAYPLARWRPLNALRAFHRQTRQTLPR